jgi:heme-degrading monooxygenase HmoA
LNPAILELAILDVRPGQEANFEKDFAIASQYISATPGYLGHELQRCLETSNRYVLLVRWTHLEAHTQGFRGSPQYLEWKKLLHKYYDPFPTVEHYQLVFDHNPAPKLIRREVE